MCLILTVRLADVDASRAEDICRVAGLPICTGEKRLLTFLRRPSGVIQIPGPEGGCGCSFLADSADWDAATWDMIPATLPRLAGILRTIGHQAIGEFSFEALWIGEVPKEDRPVTIEELARLAEESKLGTATRYHVTVKKAPNQQPPQTTTGSSAPDRV